MEMYEESNERQPRALRRLSRRKALKLMGMGVGSAALLAACGDVTNTPAPAPAATTAPAAATTAATQATTAAGAGAATTAAGAGAGAATTAAGAGAATTAATGTGSVGAPALIKGSGKIVISTGRDATGTFKKQLEDYNKLGTGITVEYQELEADSSANKNKYTTLFAAKDPSIDIIAADIPWVPEFAAAGWISDISGKANSEIRKEFFESTLQGGTYKDKLYGLPWYINVGVLYYRKDLLDAAGIKPPNTFDELTDAAIKLQKPDQGLYGFVHGGFQNEGLSANWMEVLWGYGGEFYDAKTGEVVVGQGDAAEKALQWWVDNIYTRKITPTQVTGWKTPDARNVFTEGNAVFIRDWADFYGIVQGNTSKVAGKIALKPMVAAPGQKPAGCLGNWFLSVSSFTKNPEAAWAVIRYLTGPEGSKARTLGTGAPPGNRLSYEDKDVLAKYPHFASLPDVLNTAKPRPVSPAYNQASADVIQVNVANVLSQKIKPKEAVAAMAEKSKPLFAKFKG